MADRLDPFSVQGDAIKALIMFDASTRSCRFEPSLLTLVKLRVSLMIGSRFCVDRYTREALANGETIERLRRVGDRRCSHLYSKRESAALRWAETVVQAAETRVPKEAYDVARDAFAPEQLVALTAAIAAATAWNQIGLSFRLESAMCSAKKDAQGLKTIVGE